uniref:PX domain-containing protein n=1 Tax=Strigamia maritima TaxID=126957 RepID=T1JC00_STRMM
MTESHACCVDISDENESTLTCGMLSFKDTESHDRNSSSNSGSGSLLSFDSTCSQASSKATTMNNRKQTGTQIVFEIVTYKVINGLHKKYVAYTLLIKKTPGLDKFPAIVERRYSEFLDLFLNLRRQFPEKMQSVTYFPKKTVVGNFKPEIIKSRSRAFLQFLHHIYNEDELRFSDELADFFYNDEVKEARTKMQSGQFEEAIPPMENAYFVQEKILGECHSRTLCTLCEVVALHNALDNSSEALKFAEIALNMFQLGCEEENELYPSLLQLMIRLRWNLGQEKRDLESQLHDLTKMGLKVDCLPTLLDIVMKKSN